MADEESEEGNREPGIGKLARSALLQSARKTAHRSTAVHPSAIPYPLSAIPFSLLTLWNAKKADPH